MPENKKHHYVPKFYLKRFSNNKKSICLWNIRYKRKAVHASLKDQCYKDFFYGKKDNTLEILLSNLEGHASRILRNIDQHNRLPPTWHLDHKILSLFVIIQLFRTSRTVDEINTMVNQLKDSIVQNKPPSARIDGYTEREFRNKIEDFVGKLPEFCVGVAFDDRAQRAISSLKSKLLINRTRTEFVTSDQPVILYNQLLGFMSSSFGMPGSRAALASKGIQIFFPISPTKLLLLYDHNSYRVGRIIGRRLQVKREQEVIDINTLQMCSADKKYLFQKQKF